MGNALTIAINRESRRAGTRRVEDKDQLLALTNKQTNVLMGSAFVKDEVISFVPDKAALMVGPIGSNDQFRFLVETNKSTKNCFLSTFHKSRVKVDESDPQNPKVLDERVDNHQCEVAQFYESCPTELIFAAAIAGCKIKCKESKRYRVAGFDPKGGPNGNGGTDFDPAHATNANIGDFVFDGKKPVIKDEWLGPDGDEKAAEYLFDFYNKVG